MENFNPKAEAERIIDFIKENAIAFSGGVIGLSGGVDSSTCATLMTKAIGKENVLGVSMPARDSNPNDLVDAKRVAEWLGIKFEVHPLAPILDHFEVYDYIKDRDAEEIKQKYYINARTSMPRKIAYPCIMKLRSRMLIVGHYAYINDYFACQTLNKTEWMVGHFDKFGDACGDIAPIWHLYKTQVFELAKYLGVPKQTLARAPTSGNFPVTDEEELGITFEKADKILWHLENDAYDLANKIGVNIKDVQRIIQLVKDSKSKRDVPVTLLKME